MASPKLPEHVTVLPLTDPNLVPAAFAHDIIVDVIGDTMVITFTMNRTKDFDPITGKTTSERIVTGRTVMSLTTGSAMSDCIRQTLTARAAHQDLVGSKPN